MIRSAIYQLKRQYGNGPIDIYQHGDPSTDLTTGVRLDTPTVKRINKGIVLPAKIERTVVSTISKISADKPFVYGGSYDRTRRMFIIDKKDAPDLSLSPDDWLVYQDRKYKVASHDEFELAALWVLIAHELVGERPRRVIYASATTGLRLTSEFS